MLNPTGTELFPATNSSPVFSDHSLKYVSILRYDAMGKGTLTYMKYKLNMAVLGVQIDLSKANESIRIQEMPDSQKSMVIPIMEFPGKDERLGAERGRIIINCTYNILFSQILYIFHKYIYISRNIYIYIPYILD